MLKRLFGKKQPQTLEEAKKELLENLREESMHRNVRKNFDHCLNFIKDSSEAEIRTLMSDLFVIIDTLPINQSLLAFSLFAQLAENMAVPLAKM